MATIINTALAEYGVTEIVGSKDNPRIIQYLNELGFNGERLKDETAWCSTFANWVALKAGYENTNKLNARSWLKVGKKTDNPKIGDVVVFWRQSRNSWKGHVAFFISRVGNDIYVLGGNQGNKVCIKAYPAHRLLGYRKLNKI